MKRLIAALLLTLLALGMTPRDADGDGRPSVAAVRTETPIRVDGVLDEPVWARARPVTNFRLYFDREGQVPAESTAVRVAFDDERIYFGIWCGHRLPGRLRSSLAPRDQIEDDDQVSVNLDTYLDRHRAYVFGVNPHGVQIDGILVGTEPDFSWDAVWDAEVTRSPGAWTAEIAIPLRSLRFPENGPGEWGLWIRRQITAVDEVCSWPPFDSNDQGDVMLQEGVLTGLQGLRGGGSTELQPYATSTRESVRQPSGAPAAPPIGAPALGPWSTNDRYDLGLDVKRSLTSTLTLNATVNPDFSQIEADALQIDVNQRFPLYYEEKRPFFLEGAEIFSSPMSLVYTRRIADPSVGGKLTGQAGRVRLGAIAVADDGGGSTAGIGAHADGGPSSPGFFSIGRATYDLGERSSVGLLVADHRARANVPVPAGPLGAPVATGAGGNTVVAADANLRLGRFVYFTGQVAGSSTRVDSSDFGGRVPRSRFSDVAYDLNLRFADAVHDLTLYQTYLGPDFRAESGFLNRVDIRQTGINSNFFVRPENAWIRSWQPILNGYVIHDHTGGLQEWWVSPMIDWQFERQTHVHTMYERSMERWLGRDYDKNAYILILENSNWRPLSGEFEMVIGDGIFYGPTDAQSFLGWSESYQFSATARPTPWFTSELTAERSRLSRSYGGTEVFDVWVLGAKTTWQFTRRLYARLYPQYDTGSEHLDGDALVGYVLHPGTVVYLGVNGDFDRLNGRHRATGRTFFLKLSYLIQT